MEKPSYRSALIVGTGPGLSASLARLFTRNGLAVAVAARQTDKLAALAKETGASVHACNAADPAQVAALFETLDAKGGAPDVVVYNASSRVRGPLIDIAADDVKRAMEISAFGAFLVSQQAARRMLPNKHGAIFLTGATAGVKGFALSATFAMGKFALRGLAQSMARELSPQGIHVAHFVIDGGIRSAARPVPDAKPDSLLDPDAIAETYWSTLHQHRSAWSWEIEVRPWVENF
jgi:NAD(P)-dependent dehydrogenase (short-subunit alcohol dehydrogenase family)